MTKFLGMLSMLVYIITTLIFVSFAMIGTTLAVNPSKAQLIVYLALIVNITAFVIFAWAWEKTSEN